MPERTVYRITPSGSGWSLTSGGDSRAFENKEEAIKAGRDAAQSKQPSQLVVHLANGQIETEYTYGDDPARSPG